MGSLLGFCGLLSMNAVNFHDYSGGGFIGDMMARQLLPLLNWVGTTLFLLGLCLSGCVLLTGIRFMRVVDTVGQAVITGCTWLLSIRSHHALFDSCARCWQRFSQKLTAIQWPRARKRQQQAADTASQPTEEARIDPISTR